MIYWKYQKRTSEYCLNWTPPVCLGTAGFEANGNLAYVLIYILSKRIGTVSEGPNLVIQLHSYFRVLNHQKLTSLYNYEGYVLLRLGISLKVIYEKVKFSNCDFCNNYCDYEQTFMYTIQKHT